MNKAYFEEIVKTRGKKILSYLIKILKHREDAEDILQEVFISFYQRADDINQQAYDSYLYRMAHNKALNLIKSASRKHETPMPDINFFASESTENTESEDENRNVVVKEAFSKLPERQALALELQIYQKKNYQEIAEIMETTTSAVDSLLIRAKRSLRQSLKEFRGE
ncbi:MAG: sigma-70 family RNA polymerase sigma factor [Candidatus Cloacimonetes bacterium]|nr:sigma-70 family RNA polymerase sigma factor [Candidatus Cloacimonadota bacterium]